VDRTVVLIVLDSVGIGALPDAHEYGDEGSNTLGRVLDLNPGLTLPNLVKLGLGRIAPHPRLSCSSEVKGAVGRGLTRSPAKDTITGHWEMAGIILDTPFKTFPNGFPPEVIDALVQTTGRNYLGNVVASGTEIIKDLGLEHVSSGSPILYTSADSVLQIAAHEDVIPLAELYSICAKAREIMRGDVNVARIIARPFSGEWPYERTPNRRDYAVTPPTATMLDLLSEAGQSVTGIGKICDIYANRGLHSCLKSKNNAQGMAQILDTYIASHGGLIFANLVDYDMLFGHRNDAIGYGAALKEFDDWLPTLLQQVKPQDYIFLVADHGCDPGFPGTDHTREYVPIMVYSHALTGLIELGDRLTLADIGATIIDIFGLPPSMPGSSFKAELGG